MNEKTNSSGQGRHSFAFEGRKILYNMGVSWFVSYCYYDKNDRTHRNWEKYPERVSSYTRTAHYHRSWLEKVPGMNPKNLNKNEIGLTGDEVIKMAKILLNIGIQSNKAAENHSS